ncbi:MAG TPA: hypothetical protein VK555_01320 [Terriglobales bacterium]|nr:hypothetical protein [Terriglobales bacterium]
MGTEIFFGKSEIKLDRARIKRPSRSSNSHFLPRFFGKRGCEIAGEHDCVHAGYAAIGSNINLALRRCDEAEVNQIVVSRVFGMVEPWVEGNSLEELHLKGFNHPVLAVEILRWREEGREVAAAEAPRREQQPS